MSTFAKTSGSDGTDAGSKKDSSKKLKRGLSFLYGGKIEDDIEEIESLTNKNLANNAFKDKSLHFTDTNYSDEEIEYPTLNENDTYKNLEDEDVNENPEYVKNQADTDNDPGGYDDEYGDNEEEDEEDEEDYDDSEDGDNEEDNASDANEELDNEEVDEYLEDDDEYQEEDDEDDLYESDSNNNLSTELETELQEDLTNIHQNDANDNAPLVEEGETNNNENQNHEEDVNTNTNKENQDIGEIMSQLKQKISNLKKNQNKSEENTIQKEQIEQVLEKSLHQKTSLQNNEYNLHVQDQIQQPSNEWQMDNIIQQAEDSSENYQDYNLLDKEILDESSGLHEDNQNNENDDFLKQEIKSIKYIPGGEYLPDDKFNFQLIPIDFITPNPNQPRKTFTENELLELTSSIAKFGILQPIIVAKINNSSYQIIAGERRYRACLALNKPVIPSIITDLYDNQRFETSIIENTQRQNLNPIEEAGAYKYLIEKYDYTQDEVAEVVNKSRAHVANLLRILNLPHSVKELVADSLLSLGHAKLLVGLSQSAMFAKIATERKLSVRELEKLIQKTLREVNSSGDVRKKILLNDIQNIENSLFNNLSRLKEQKIDVKISHGKKTGSYKAILSFASKEDTEEFFKNI